MHDLLQRHFFIVGREMILCLALSFVSLQPGGDILSVQSPNSRNKYRALKAKQSPLVKIRLISPCKEPIVKPDGHVKASHNTKASEARILLSGFENPSLKPIIDFQVNSDPVTFLLLSK